MTFTDQRHRGPSTGGPLSAPNHEAHACSSTDLSDWRQAAACIGTPIDWWFPTEGPGRPVSGTQAQRIPPEAAERCSMCAVRQECLDHAIRNEAFGVWAGMSARQIQQLRKAAGVRLDDSDQVAEERARRLHEQGTPPQRIAEVLNVNLRTVYRLLARAGVQLTAEDDWRRSIERPNRWDRKPEETE